jgi:hypothetical protein
MEATWLSVKRSIIDALVGDCCKCMQAVDSKFIEKNPGQEHHIWKFGCSSGNGRGCSGFCRPENVVNAKTIWSATAGILASIYGGKGVVQAIMGEMLAPSVFDPGSVSLRAAFQNRLSANIQLKFSFTWLMDSRRFAPFCVVSYSTFLPVLTSIRLFPINVSR